MRESARRRQADTSRILVGYWRESTEPEPNQHAVYGILSRDGTLRFKVVSETRDGRPIQCKSLLSPGDSWIIHDEVVLEPHLRHLNRLEMKEYCRVRQHHIDQGEEGQDMAANILNSVELAKQIAEASYSRERPRNLRWAREKCADERRARRKLKKRLISEAAQLEEHVTVAGPDAEAKPDMEAAKTEAEIQVNVSQVRVEDARVQDHIVRSNSFTAIRPAARSTPPVPVRESETAPPQPSAHVHVHAPAPPPALSSGRRDWHSVIQPHMRTVSPPIAAPPPPPPLSPPPPPPPPPAPTMAPPALPTARGSKSYGGIRYDWKDTGLFTQKYVSRGCIITIDDEDYVEYRVLTKPAFI
ncbi:hypothetical protein C2857_000819 [Epichloe festucae Fl1]|uniref:Uncharacterized protein n=1 Tax=Epichloe festucae (strain Fl1) TaxID=877507 RepID=A0A7S9KJT7_EPIFF|nr:hypothetical protein C2857_000819 [Epichloe festucae Fl1]